MPARSPQHTPPTGPLCRRCQQHEPAITVRSELLCRDCFTRYVHTKVVKRMDPFRVRHAEPGKGRKLLLPISFGVCSLALLHILSQHLNGQAEKTGRTGFRLCVVYVDDGESAATSTADLLQKARDHYPEHEYAENSLFHIAEFEDLSALICSCSNMPDGEEQENLEDRRRPRNLATLLDNLSSATSRTDVLQILKRKFIVHLAKRNGCEAILWGDSTTRLAERTLAETAKGRGFSLPWLVADGESPSGMSSYYPMRDLLTKEIAAYIGFVDPPLDELVIHESLKPAVSARNATIDDLMKQYFESVEREYPSIVANVVKTAGKLQPLPLNALEQQCELCGMPLDGKAPERSRLCYGCIRTLPQAAG